jgi:hypothetical protein
MVYGAIGDKGVGSSGVQRESAARAERERERERVDFPVCNII